MSWSKVLRVGQKNNSCIRVTQENSIEIPLQTSLPYILLLMVYANYCIPYPKGPCIEYEINIWYLYCMISFVLEPSTLFYTSCDPWLLLTLTLCSKNRKVRKQNENENRNKEKLSLLFVNLIYISYFYYFFLVN